MFRMGKYDKVFLLSNDLQFLPIWVIVAMSYVLAKKETFMSEIEVTLSEIVDDYTDEEELEWDTLFAQPLVQAGLDRLAEEAE